MSRSTHGIAPTRVWPAVMVAAGVGVQVGAATVASRWVVDDVGPATLALLRYAIGACCLLPFFLAAPRVRFQGRDLAAICALGIGQFGILVALLNLGLLTVAAARAVLLFATFPLMTMLLAAALGRERLSLAKSLGVAVSFAGVGLALLDKLAVGQAGSWSGVAAVLAAALTGAVCSVLYRPYLQKYPTLPVSTLAMLASVAFLALLAVPEGAFGTVPRLGAGAWAAVAFIGLSSGLGYYGWLWALARLPPTQVTVFLSLSPITAALLGTLLLGEALSPLTLAGVAAVAAGLVIAFARQISRGKPRSRMNAEVG